jgi:hypothetical protein
MIDETVKRCKLKFLTHQLHREPTHIGLFKTAVDGSLEVIANVTDDC